MKERFNHEFHESSFCSKPYWVPFHIGGARSALFSNWLLARKEKAYSFVLRIEDNGF